MRGLSAADKVVNASKTSKRTGCWIWQLACRDGYGLLYHDGRTQTAHVLSYEVSTGRPVPSKMRVTHTCGCRACVNPKHLKLATRSEVRVSSPPSGQGYKHRR